MICLHIIQDCYIAGMRDIIAHQYDRIDLEIVWQAVHRNIPELMEKLIPLLPTNDSIS